ncbi:DNA polymerase III subunit gamma/tau [Microbacterium protaetiae]|uniref:DNA polymerase III subunit gamma/tau n=1 Tax=Microbacterium protaetiae TaxID=2509458 RepID=A0A4P6ELJ7_9MICO|nr:DNA polymerase III subunit gamma/tau [Microbacterium protaetiae]QAY61097.1 DNA polymerase III subunit gamma/tau [Microbacterium protaetiae]
MAPDPHTPDDDDALRWDGDDEPQTVLPAGWVAKGKGAERVTSTDDQTQDAASDASSAAGIAPVDDAVDAVDEAGSAALGNAALIGLGVLGGVYLLFTIGWIIGGLRLQGVATYLVSPAASVPAVWLAALAPVIWFGTTLWLTRRTRTWLRFTWLIVGAVLLVPWPFALLGGMGQ